MADRAFRIGGMVTTLGNPVKVGDKAQVFDAVNTEMKTVLSSEYKGKVVIISVFPSVDTPVCAAQNRRFNKEATALGKDVVVLSISVDLPFAQKRFCGAEGIDRVVMLSDYRNRDFGAKYGFLIEDLQLLSRGVVVIDKEGIIRYVEYLDEAAKEPDYDKAIAAAKKLL